MPKPGFYRLPSLGRETVVFASEDDLWSVPSQGGIARRLSSGMGQASRSAPCPDGQWLAFNSSEEGHTEVYLMPSEGGPARRITYMGGNTRLLRWTADGKILFASAIGQSHLSLLHIYTIDPIKGGLPQRLPLGPAVSVSFGPGQSKVIGRTGSKEPTIWKRYRGGTAGEIWMDREGDGNFKRFIQLKGNLVDPMWIGDRIFFLSDHEGSGNIYSASLEGTDIKRHTDHEDYYVRQPFTDGKKIVYNCGADLYLLDPATSSKKIPIEFHGPRPQTQRKFVDAAEFLEDYDIHPQGHLAAVVTRGKSFTLGNWDGPVTPVGATDGVRYRHFRWLNDGKRLVGVSDEDGEEKIVVFSNEAAETFPSSLGRIQELKVSPTADHIVMTNHRNELIWINLTDKSTKTIAKGIARPFCGFNWSPDGNWVVYGLPSSELTATLQVYEVSTGKTHPITSPLLFDFSPVFDPEGKYIYFLSSRFLDPVYEEVQFTLGFPKATKPCLVTLRKDVESPFLPVPLPLESEKPDDKKEDETKIPVKITIDFDGIFDRVLSFPVPEAIYQNIEAIKGKALFSSIQPQGTLNQGWMDSELPAQAILEAFDFETQKPETWVTGISTFSLTRDRKILSYRVKNQVRVLKADKKPDEALSKEPPGRKSGWMDLKRIKLSILPSSEWKQMYGEAWRLQRDHFWTEDMSKIDWENIYRRYLPILERASSRSEYADVIMEMQGELGTSHAYEMGGDYRKEPRYELGYLGANLSYDLSLKCYRIDHILKGDTWLEGKYSPLARPGLMIQDGDTLLAVNGTSLSESVTPQSLLLHQASNEVVLKVGDSQGKSHRTVTVRTIRDETPVRYREWVEKNRAAVHKASNGKLGYVHIPNMGPLGFSEFHRSFIPEVSREGLVIDVRFNGGGHVSQLLLEKLARRKQGFTLARWYGVTTYPTSAPNGPMVALTNEFAGSDGDIFSHTFKLLNLGPLIGKRTWGGVIGIWPRNRLVDGGMTTQPEFSFWFKDVGWKVENYGTDPTMEVEFLPQDYVAGRDPQLERGIQEALKILEKYPSLKPEFEQRPDLKAPSLIKR